MRVITDEYRVVNSSVNTSSPYWLSILSEITPVKIISIFFSNFKNVIYPIMPWTKSNMLVTISRVG